MNEHEEFELFWSRNHLLLERGEEVVGVDSESELAAAALKSEKNWSSSHG